MLNRTREIIPSPNCPRKVRPSKVNNPGCTVIFRELLQLQKWSKNFRYTITPFWGYFQKSSCYSQSGVKITPKMGLFLLFTWVVFTLFGVNLTLKMQ